MKVIADFHIHSKYSRACSQLLDLPHLDYWAKLKGFNIIGAGDFTHPEWFRQISEQLEEAAPGLYRLRDEFKLPESKNWSKASGLGETLFLLSSEISCIYSKNDKVRRIHLLVFAPSLAAVSKINQQLSRIGNLSADGRPILGLDAAKLTELVLKTDPGCMVVPAHAWTPWFAVFGSKSGFDSLEECFDQWTPHIRAIETGLSSDAPMNWRLSKLDSISLISNSDAHSLPNLGREANVFNLETVDYFSLTEAIKNKDKKSFVCTLEFFPEEGKYHLDGHASCAVRLEPDQTRQCKGLCPKCGKPVTVGVLNRVDCLADRPVGFQSEDQVPFKYVVPLVEIIADAFSKKKTAKLVQNEYQKMVRPGSSEFAILLDLTENQLNFATQAKVAEGIIKVRKGEVKCLGGYDGIYGTVKIFAESSAIRQKRLI